MLIPNVWAKRTWNRANAVQLCVLITDTDDVDIINTVIYSQKPVHTEDYVHFIVLIEYYIYYKNEIVQFQYLYVSLIVCISMLCA